VRTRPSTPADHAFLRELHHAAYRDAIVRQFGAWDERAQDAWFEQGLELAVFSIVEEAELRIGAIALVSAPDCLHLVELQILPEWQDRGLGSALIDRQLSEARARGVPIRLRVLRENRARALYQRKGFVVTGENDTHYLMEWRP
jgi:ribosomal protein S18 acetylase RimI-like enzyme